jgi:hypothetical protein
MLTKDHYIEHVIPYRMRSVAVLNVATKYVMTWDKPRALQIYFDEKLAIRGLSTAFTNPAIEAGIIHCRALLEFLGLRVSPKDPSKLVERSGKRDDDYVIEDFSGPHGSLPKITVAEAISPYDGPRDEAETALAAVIHCANKGLAHMTTGHVVNLKDVRLYEIASRGVPTLVANYFYVPQGIKPPDWQLTSSQRNVV